MKRRISALRPLLLRTLLAAAVVLLLPGTAAAHARTVATAAPSRPETTCQRGEFCVWSHEFFGGSITRFDLRNTNPEECVPLPAGVEARSFGNRIDRHVTVYQDRECSTEGDFSTYPGSGTFVPQSPYVVRAIQLWN